VHSLDRSIDLPCSYGPPHGRGIINGPWEERQGREEGRSPVTARHHPLPLMALMLRPSYSACGYSGKLAMAGNKVPVG